MNPLPVMPLFPIKHCVFILGPHLRLRRHLLFPPLQPRCRSHVVLLERIVDRCYHVVDETEAFALAALLGDGKTPGSFPVNRTAVRYMGHDGDGIGLVGGVRYQRRPPERGEVVLKAPNMILLLLIIDASIKILEETEHQREMAKKNDDRVNGCGNGPFRITKLIF